jgi:hypothetical protein
VVPWEACLANPEVSRLIQELSQILEQNRQKRNTADAMMMGLQQGQQAAQARRNEQAAAAGKAGHEASKGAGRAAQAVSFADPSTSYGDDRKASPYSRSASPGMSASALSPSTTREGRMGLASKYIEAQGGSSQREAQLLDKNPYTGSGYEFLPENAAAPSMTPDPALEEQKKRFTQNLMLSRGQTGGPMGGAGQAPPPGDGLDPAVVGAVSRSGGPVGQMQPGAAPQVAAGPPAGWSPEDYGLLEQLSQRYPGG